MYHVGKALLHDIDRGAGVILFEPQHGGPHGIISSYTRIAPDGTLHSPRSQRTGGGMHPSFYSKSPSSTGAHHHHQQSPSSGRIVPRSLSFDGDATVVDEDEMAVPQVTKNLSVPADMVGCLIGRGGSLISHIRRTSGARLHVSEQQEGAIERVVTIAGSDDSVTKALQLIYSQLENEKERREQAAQQQQETPAPSNPSEVMAGGGSE